MNKQLLLQWRATAKDCKYRTFDGSRLKRGNPLCSAIYGGMRCTHSQCPYQMMRESGSQASSIKAYQREEVAW